MKNTNFVVGLQVKDNKVKLTFVEKLLRVNQYKNRRVRGNCRDLSRLINNAEMIIK